jgi:hypothetical protein
MAASISWVLRVAASRILSVGLHEGAHFVAARLGGHRASVEFSWNGTGVTTVCPSGKGNLCLPRHAGWLFSVGLVCFILALWPSTEDCAMLAGFAWTAGDAVISDLLTDLQWLQQSGTGEDEEQRLFCGNFGLLLLSSGSKRLVQPALRLMMQTTTMRGAQAAGLVTYTKQGRRGLVGHRSRVVNSKRGDLTARLLYQFKRRMSARCVSVPQLFQGHTRFATSSIANFEGTHPHQWLPPTVQPVWEIKSGAISESVANVEMYVTHVS